MIKEENSSKSIPYINIDKFNNLNNVTNDNFNNFDKSKFDSTNVIFKNLFQTRNKYYFEKTLLSNNAKTPLTYFINKHCDSLMSDIIFTTKIKVSKYEKDIFYVFILSKYLVLTNDYIDYCSINFCSMKNPIIIKCDLCNIERSIINNEKNSIEVIVGQQAEDSMDYTHM